MGMLIRLAEFEDLPEIVAIYNSTVASRQVTADLQVVTVAERQNWLLGHLRDVQRPVYVVVNQGRLVAWASLSDYYPRAAYRISAEVSIYVHEDCRGQGIGRSLLQYLLQRASCLGVVNVLAVIFGHNQPSLHLFKQLGFQQWGRLPEVCDLGEQMADVLILGKRLPERVGEFD